jgi:hypothetical protein
MRDERIGLRKEGPALIGSFGSLDQRLDEPRSKMRSERRSLGK